MVCEREREREKKWNRKMRRKWKIKIKEQSKEDKRGDWNINAKAELVTMTTKTIIIPSVSMYTASPFTPL